MLVFGGENGNLILDEIHIARRAEIVPHAAPTSGQGPKPGLIEAGKTESESNSLDTSLAVLEIIDKIL